jgi:broad specificity phosphatase PhoE
MGNPSKHPIHEVSPSHLKYTTITGFFLQDDPATDPQNFDYVISNLGLINQTYPTDPEYDPDLSKSPWQRFAYYIRHLNTESPKTTTYRLLYLARHGEGFHNVAQSHYGTKAWDCYWSKLTGNGSISWADARLTANGIAQAKVAHDFWRATIINQGIPVPQSYYVSPLDRCLATANVTFAGLEDVLPKEYPFVPVVKELLREALGVHTCDRRSNREYIVKNYPGYVIEKGFAEVDPLWVPDVRESNAQMVVRLKTLLDDIVTNDENMFISLTSHSGSITSMLHVLGHRQFGLQTGGVIPVLVKVDRVEGQAPITSVAPGIPAPTCEMSTKDTII